MTTSEFESEIEALKDDLTEEQILWLRNHYLGQYSLYDARAVIAKTWKIRLYVYYGLAMSMTALVASFLVPFQDPPFALRALNAGLSIVIIVASVLVAVHRPGEKHAIHRSGAQALMNVWAQYFALSGQFKDKTHSDGFQDLVEHWTRITQEHHSQISKIDKSVVESVDIKKDS